MLRAAVTLLRAALPAAVASACAVALLAALLPAPALADQHPPPLAGLGAEAERAEAQRVEAERAEAERVEAERAEAERAERERRDQQRTGELREKRRTAGEQVAASESALTALLASYNRAHGDMVVARLDLEDAQEQLVESERRILDAEEKRSESTVAREEARRALGVDAAAAYRAGSTRQTAQMMAMEAVVRSRDEDEFARGLTYLKAMLGSRAQDVVDAEENIESSQAARLTGEHVREQAREDLDAAKAALAAGEGEVSRQDNRLKAGLAAHRGLTGELAAFAAAQRAATEEADTPFTADNVALTRELARMAAESAAVADRLQGSSARIAAGRDGVTPWREFRCPVEGTPRFVNDWGFPRSGGRSHEGTDVFAEQGTPIVAMADAVVQRISRVDSGLGGRSVSYEVDGHRIYNAHLDTVAPGLEVGDRLEAGQVIGTVGTSGNARFTPPHNHVGLYLPDGAPVNPYPILRRACR